MSKTKIAKQTLTLTTTGVLFGSVTVAFSLLAFFGMYAIIPIVGIAWASFALYGVIDGEVILQNIHGGIKNLPFLMEKNLTHHLITKKFERELRNKTSHFSQAELDYLEQKKLLEKFSHKKLTKEQKAQRKAAEKKMRRMQKLITAYILKEKHNKPITQQEIEYFAPIAGNDDPENSTIIDVCTNILNSFRWIKLKSNILKTCTAVSLIAGGTFSFTTASGLAGIFVGSLAAFAPAIWPLAILAGVGYTFLIYRTVSDMLANETLAMWREKFRHWTAFDEMNPKKSIARRVFLTAVAVIAVGLAIVATLATAGTWWFAVKNGAELLQLLAPVAAIIASVLVPFAAIATLVFSIKNSLTTVNEISNDTKDASPLDHLKRLLVKIGRTINPITYIADNPGKSIAELYNPFRIIAGIISFPFMFAIFVGHMVAMGVAGDRTPGLSYEAMIASSFFGALSDAFVDYHYISGHDHQHKSVKKHILDEEEKHDHTHGVIPKLALATILTLSLVAPLSALWTYLAAPADKPVKLGTEFLKLIGFHHQHDKLENAPVETTMPTYQRLEDAYRLNKQKERLSKSFGDQKEIDAKITALDNIAIEVSKSNPDKTKLNEASIKLNTSRKFGPFLFDGKKPKSARVADQIISQKLVAAG